MRPPRFLPQSRSLALHLLFIGFGISFEHGGEEFSGAVVSSTAYASDLRGYYSPSQLFREQLGDCFFDFACVVGTGTDFDQANQALFIDQYGMWDTGDEVTSLHVTLLRG